MIKISNSITGEKEIFKPILENKVSMYVCGPTVYNYIHIGNARPMITFDLLRRIFEFEGYDVTHISNFTDVDDKIINKAIEENKPESEVSEYFIRAYLSDSKKMNIIEPTHRPRVTKYMGEIIKYIESLIDKGFAYEKNGNVYFSISKIKTYGCLSNRSVDELVVGARIEENKEKENPLDFTLWKKTEKGITWKSKWSNGRPGWHTECVAMIDNIIDKKFIDIHGGGMDLKFPHHENEIAQSIAMNGNVLANYWMHNGFINMDGDKMSKSIGNVLWVKDIIDKINPNVFRICFYQTHYLKPLNFTDDIINQSNIIWKKINNTFVQAKSRGLLNELVRDGDYINKFLDYMRDDLNTSNCLTVLLKAIKVFNKSLREDNHGNINSIWGQILQMINLLGLSF